MLRAGLILMIVPILGGCMATGNSGARLRTVRSDRDMALSADYRMVFHRTRDNKPVLCAEPSPDMARIVSAASQASLTGSAKGAKVQPEIALAFAASRAEGLAQLGQRLATIQLLRDSTYRACEAYANEAISAATYAMIVSRYDDVMITLLLGEMAASSSRPSQVAAVLASAAGTTGLSPATAEAVVQDARARLAAADKQLAAAMDAKAKLKADATEADRTAAATALAAAVKEREEASAILKAALLAVGGTSAGTSVAGGDGGGGAGQQPAGVVTAQQLAAMQSAYLNDFNLDAVTVGCLSALSALDRDKHGPYPSNSVRTDGTSFMSSSQGGAVSLQDECRATLANGKTLREAISAKLAADAARAKRGEDR